MREGINSLYNPLIPVETYFIKQNGQHYGEGEEYQYLHERDNQRIYHGRPKIRVNKQQVKIAHPYPRAAGDAVAYIITLESELHPVYRYVPEYDKKHYAGKQQQIYVTGIPNTARERLTLPVNPGIPL